MDLSGLLVRWNGWCWSWDDGIPSVGPGRWSGPGGMELTAGWNDNGGWRDGIPSPQEAADTC